MRPRSVRRQGAVISILCCLALLAGACGRKAAPRPPRRPELPAVRDLQVMVAETGVLLTWTLPSADSAVAGFNIYRSKPQLEETHCPACPLDYALISSVAVDPGQIRFEAVDRDVQGKGFFYYRVVSFDKKERSGPESNRAGIVVE